MPRRSWRMLALLLALLPTPSCKRCGVDRSAAPDPAEQKGPPVALAAPKLSAASGAKGPGRIVLDAAALERLRQAAKSKSAAWVRVEARCDEAVREKLRSGYQGFEWADAVANLSLCWHASQDDRYGEAAVRYVRTLLDDRYEMGDGKGGEGVVRHDSGYGIRTFGTYTALGSDWLRGAPGMDAALRTRIVERLSQWLDWYARDGYLNDHPFANYYWGYLSALSFAGLALAGEASVADEWLEKARSELADRVLPRFRDQLSGGGYPEGWQYGEYTSVEIALVALAFRTGAGIDVPAAMPWLADVVPHHVHALLPDERSVYDGGTWGEHPAAPSALALSAVSLALQGTNDTRAAEARWLVDHVLPPLTREQAWLGLLASRPDAPARDPRQGLPTSHHLPGQGLSFARSDWSKSAVWVSFQAGPFLSPDHQDKDQGHFELWRGSDALLVDGGDAEGAATINHNTLLIDDGGRAMNYPPNQGVWGRAVKTSRFFDDGRVVLAVGEIGDAYLPKCATEGCKKRSVERLTRTFVYVRPALLVIDDRLELERPSIGAAWAVHVTRSPIIAGELISATVGESRVDIRMLEPEVAERVALKEPTASKDGPHEKSSPWGPMWRVEVRSEKRERERGFLAFITADRKDAAPPPAQRVRGDELRGALGQSAGERIAVLFAEAGSAAVDLGAPADLVVIAGLEPGRRYRIAEGRKAGCPLSLGLAEDPAGTAASPGGFVRLRPAPCKE